MTMTFSEKLIALRKSVCETQNEMAKRVGISRPSLNHYENHVREPGISFLRKLCEEYGVSPAWMLGLEEGDDDVMILTVTSEEVKDAISAIKMAIGNCNNALNELELKQGRPL